MSTGYACSSASPVQQLHSAIALPPLPSMITEPKGKQRSSVRHTRAIQRARTQRLLSAPPAEAVVARLTEIVHPATLAQVSDFHHLGLRARLLTLPVMVGLVLSLLWRQMGGISELVRVVHTEAVLWVPPLRDLTQQALAQRLRTLPADLFGRVLQTLLPILQGRWAAATAPLPPAVAWADAHFTAVLIVDGSTLDGLLRKIGLLRDAVKAPLAGRMLTVLDRASRLPRQVWYDADPNGHDARFWDRWLPAIPSGAPVIFDRGFTDFARWATLTARNVTWLTGRKEPEVRRGEGFGAYRVRSGPNHRDRRGRGAPTRPPDRGPGPRHGLSLSDQCPRPGPVADRPSGSAVPPTLAGGRRLRHRQAVVGLGLFPLQRRKHHPNAIVDHRAVVRRVDRLDRCRRRSVGVTVRRSLSGNGLPQSHRAQWYETAQSGRRGAPRRYSDMAVQCGLVIREVFHLPLRALEGLMRSIIPLLGVE